MSGPFVEHDDVGLVGGAESGVEAGDSTADDEEIALRLLWSPVHVSHLPLLVFASESKTCARVYQSFRFPIENVRHT